MKMFKSIKENWKTYLFWVGLSEGVGGLSGFLTRNGMKEYAATTAKPPLTPPEWVFPVAWTLLYALMGIGAARVSLSPESNARNRGLNLFLAQLAMNFAWSIVFFNFETYGFAALWLATLLLLVAWMTKEFRNTDNLAGLMQVPYLLWLAFALYLNLGVWTLNG